MEKWFVAPSYKDARIITIDESTRKAHIEETCDRCSGRGLFATGTNNGHLVITPVDGGTCHKCWGRGKIDKWVKAYTEKEYNSYIAAKERTAQKKKDAEEIRKQNLLDNSEKNKAELLEKWGYDPQNPTIYLVGGGSTFPIKDQLKENGAKYDSVLGWYFKQPAAVPEGYTLVSVAFDDIYTWWPLAKRIDINENAKEVVAAALSAYMPKSNSEYLGEEKERLRGLKARVTGIRTTEGYYGTVFIYSFLSDENVLVWFSSSSKDIEEGDEIILTGTVKAHKEYNGIKQTVLSRCIIKKESE